MERKILDFCELQIRNYSSLLLPAVSTAAKMWAYKMFLSSSQGVTFQRKYIQCSGSRLWNGAWRWSGCSKTHWVTVNVNSESYISDRKWSVQWFEFYSDQIRRSSCSLHVIDALHFPSHHIITGAWQLDTTYLDTLCLESRQTLFKLTYSRAFRLP